MPDLKDGESTEMKGSGAKPYILKNTGGVYSCTCMSWRNQSLAIDKRTCKHLRKLRGDAAEEARIGGTKLEPIKKEATVTPPPLLLAHSWDGEQDVTGWWMSEKLDGVRAWWDGTRFISRLGNTYHAPDSLLKLMPKNVILDGELWIGRKCFQETVSIVRRQDKPDIWSKVKYLVFDMPSEKNVYEVRVASYIQLLSKKKALANRIVPLVCGVVEDNAHVLKHLAAVEKVGGEGVMLRQPGSLYEAGRSNTLLKVKSFKDAEAIVIGHEPGKGKHKGRLGALYVKTPAGVEFKLGSGMNDAEREDPPAIGSVVTYKYQELTDGGVPRFPTFVAVRDYA